MQIRLQFIRTLTLRLLSAWFLLYLLALPTQAQSDLTGVIDIHVHSAPDSTPRSIDAIDLAKLAKQRGMRGLVLKNHYESTAALAYVVRKEVPGIEIFGGIDLNRSVGGINPAAIERKWQERRCASGYRRRPDRCRSSCRMTGSPASR